MTWNTMVVPEEQRERFHRIGTDLCFCSDRLDRDRLRDPERNPPTEPPEQLHQTEEEILAPLLEDGFELVGTGLARCVLRFPSHSSLSEYVIKLARFGIGPLSLGAIQNQREVMLWARYGEAGNWPLLPVEDFHLDRYRWLIMPYGKPLTDVSSDRKEEILRQIRGHGKLLPTFDIREVHEENVVLVDGTPYLADYGLPEGN